MSNTGNSGDSRFPSFSEWESKRFLAPYGVPVVDELKAADTEEAFSAAEQIGFPVVLKGLGSKLLHKSESGLVHLHLNDAEALRRAAGQIAERAGEALEGFLLQPQVTGKREFVADRKSVV